MSERSAEADYERATRYPWERPETSYLLRDGEVVPLTSAEQLETLSGAGRTALITFGSNGSPQVLRRKLSQLPEAGELAVLTGWLEGFAVAPSAHLALYGALPATILRDPASRVRAGLLLVDDAQLEAIGLTEFNYHVVRLTAEDFSSDLKLPRSAAPLAYVSRHGHFAPAGHDTRTLSQAAVLELAADVVLGPHGDGRELVRRTIADYRWAMEVAEPALAEHAERFERAQWEIVSTARAERSQ